MKKKIVYLPLDERPCNYAFASMVSENNPDFRVVCPDKSAMGQKKIPADHEALAQFLKTECEDAYGLALSVDTLLYGGILPSRLHTLSEEVLTDRLYLLKELKAKNPALKIFAFGLIMRCPSYSSSDEEPDYYEYCGREIFLRGQASHKFEVGVITESEYTSTVTELDKKIGDNLEDYLQRRKRNLVMLFKTLKMVGKEIDKFVVPQDDSSPYGYTAIDQQKVRAFIEREGLPAVDIYPGADEVGMTMLSAFVNDLRGTAVTICPVYPAEECKKVIPLYEDRAVERSIASQIKSAGCYLTEDEEKADILLFCNLPVGKMQDAAQKGGEQYEKRNLPAFVEKMRLALEKGKRVAAADLAYCNGGDEELVVLIEQSFGVFRLSGYAGWNTSSNSLGTVICQAVMHYYYGDTPTHRAFTAERIYEDVGYCGRIRRLVTNDVLPAMDGLNYFHADGKDGKVAEIVKEKLDDYIGELLPAVRAAYVIDKCEMPWSRMFEVDLTVKPYK